MKIKTLLIASLTLAVCLSACGSGNVENSPPVESTAPVESAAPVESTAPVDDTDKAEMLQYVPDTYFITLDDIPPELEAMFILVYERGYTVSGSTDDQILQDYSTIYDLWKLTGEKFPTNLGKIHKEWYALYSAQTHDPDNASKAYSSLPSGIQEYISGWMRTFIDVEGLGNSTDGALESGDTKTGNEVADSGTSSSGSSLNGGSNNSGSSSSGGASDDYYDPVEIIPIPGKDNSGEGEIDENLANYGSSLGPGEGTWVDDGDVDLVQNPDGTWGGGGGAITPRPTPKGDGGGLSIP